MTHNRHFANYVPVVPNFRTIAAGARYYGEEPAETQWVLLEAPEGFVLDESASDYIIDCLGFWEYTPASGRIGRRWTHIQHVNRRILCTSELYRDC